MATQTLSYTNTSSKTGSLLAAMGLFFCCFFATRSTQASASEKGRILVVPLGKDSGFVATAQVARAVRNRLKKGRGLNATLYYPLEQYPPLKPGLLKKAERHLKEAHQAFQQMEFDSVKGHTQKALSYYKIIIKSGLGYKQYLETQHLIAATALLEDESVLAHQAMNDAILFDPQPPSSKQFNPQVQDFFKKVKSEPPPEATFSIKSEPPALMWLNRKLLGLAQGTYSARPGLSLLQVFRPGYLFYQRWVRFSNTEERKLQINLQKDPASANEVAVHLRDELTLDAPGANINQLIVKAEAQSAVVISSDTKCKPRSCKIYLNWARGGRYVEREVAIYRGNGSRTAQELIKVKKAAPRALALQPSSQIQKALAGCVYDDQCKANEVCRNGKCLVPQSITSKWWFWGIVGTAVLGVTLAIAIPAAQPDSPVIEVK